jgi:hypothetical protein
MAHEKVEGLGNSPRRDNVWSRSHAVDLPKITWRKRGLRVHENRKSVKQFLQKNIPRTTLVEIAIV